MVSAMKAFLAVFIFASVFCSISAIRCYQCDSLIDNKCGEPFESDEKNLVDCSIIAPPRFLQNIFPVHNATGCMKRHLDSVGGRVNIVRTCYYGDVMQTQGGCQSDPTLPFIKQFSCDVCTKDKCNGASATGPITGAIVLFFTLARIMS